MVDASLSRPSTQSHAVSLFWTASFGCSTLLFVSLLSISSAEYGDSSCDLSNRLSESGAYPWLYRIPMDFLHDSVALPGSSSHTRRSDIINDAASHSGVSEVDNTVRVPQSLLVLLRKPSSLLGSFAGISAIRDTGGQAGPDSDNEWQKQVLRLKLRQVGKIRRRIASCTAIADHLG